MPHFSFFNAPIKNLVPTSVMSLSDCYRYIIGDTAKSRTDTLRTIADKAERSAFKAHQLDYVTPSGEFAKRSAHDLIRHSGLLCLDFDHIGERLGSIKDKLRLDETFPTILAFTSPSGDGLKVILKLNVDAANHGDMFRASTRYFELEYGILADQSGKDISRACFLCHDPEAIYRESDTPSPFRLEEYLNENSSNQSAGDIVMRKDTTGDIRGKVERLIEKVKESRVDITSRYADWLRTGFALANAFGESGRGYFHDLSRFYPGYTAAETDKKFDECMKSDNGQTTIGSLFFLAKKAGIEISNTTSFAKNHGAHSAHSAHIDQTSSETGACTFADDPELKQLSTLTDKISEKLPRILQRCIEGASSIREADVRVMASIAVISSLLPNVYGIYGGHKIYPHIFVILDGPASSGKGNGDVAKFIAKPIHDYLLKDYDSELNRYRIEHQIWENNGKEGEEPKAPLRKMVFIPADSTNSAFISQLAHNGGEGLILDMELDTVNGSFKSRHGNYSPALRKAAHHETVSMRRRGNDEYIEVREPRVALCIAGTPNQVNRFVGDAENGFFSRVQFYCLPLDLSWVSPWTPAGEVNAVSQFQEIGNTFFDEYYRPLKHHPGDIVVHLNETQKSDFDQKFYSAKYSMFTDEGISILPTVHRMGLFCYRTAMILSVLKVLECHEAIDGEIICDDDSFDAALSLSMNLLEHARFVYRHLPSSATGTNPPVEKLLQALPATFARKDYHSAAEKLGINPRTADRYMHQLVDHQRLSKEGHDCYIKS